MNIKVRGGQVLSGEIYPSGNKNSALYVITATLLFDKLVTLENIPEITDVAKMQEVLELVGGEVIWNTNDNKMSVDNSKATVSNLSTESIGKMRGATLLWGPLLARFKKLDFTGLPGGCTLGFRTFSAHFNAFRDLGVKITETNCGLKMDATGAHSGTVWLTEMSPTATGNILMFATSLKGITRIIGAASEPGVQDMCNMLVKAGAKINGIGSSMLEIYGGHELKPVTYKIISDYHEITTFLALAAITGGKIKVHNSIPEHFAMINRVFSKFGIKINYEDDTAIIEKDQKIGIFPDDEGRPLTIKAQPWPALPVDTLPLFIPIALTAKSGQALFHNWMYDAGLFWTSELSKLGANIVMCDPHRVLVIAGNELKGNTLEAPYIIRAVVAMVMAAMVSKGESMILNADALYRGHPHFSENLRALGAQVEEIDG